jgi:vacuolar-type H+-ATPase subunit E/Vma4
MSETVSRGGEDEIIGKILSDGQTRAKRILDGAERTAESERRKAEAEADKVRKETMDQVARKAETVRSKEVAGAHIEAKRILLRAREDAISRVFETIREELKKVHDDESRYRDALVRAIGGSGVTVALCEEDRALSGADLAAEIEAKLAREGSGDIKIHIVIDPGVVGGGCVARSGDSRVIFDNTFPRRLERMKPSLRSIIVNEVLKSDG